jgi:lipopolysaccharide/colanic/teichoic acid biosynthesis glycosyltransferase
VTAPAPAATPQHGPRRAVKVALDKMAAAGALLLLSPLIGLTALAIRFAMGRPVLFSQKRPGLHGRTFSLLKFRTMREPIASTAAPLSDETRLTRLGKVLRATSLDELPQLWNVLSGDLSLVGPRPLLVEYLERYTPEQARRHDVLPGITGWAQVNGRNAIGWEEKFALDVWYVDHWSLSLDARILCQTLGQVLSRRGVSREGYATMPEFLGKREREKR